VSEEAPPHIPVASSGVADLDRALHGLYWGDNVVFEPDRTETAMPFYGAIAALTGMYDQAAYVSLSLPPELVERDYPGLGLIDARPDTPLAEAGALLNAIRRRCKPQSRTLLLFDPLDDMAARWGADMARRFFTRCCPLLLEVGAIAYWSLSQGERFEALRRDVEDVTQCVLVVRDGRLRIAKAEGRPVGVQGSVYHYRLADGHPELTQAPAAARLGGALRAVRMQRQLSQAQLAQLAEVSASAISQAERGQRGLSLETLLTLTANLNITVDELLRGHVSPGYRLGRRDDPAATPTGTPVPLLDDPEAGLRAYLVRLAPGATATPNVAHKGSELVAVIAGLVQVQLTSGRPVLRQGEALLADRTSIRGWRNIGQRPAALFWVIRD
jgi:transcriptional regulator with XRE-family HTH domain